MQKKYAQINDLSQKEITTLFEFICSKIILQKPSDVKRDLLDIDGSPSDVRDYDVTMNDITKLIDMLGLDCSFKLIYTDVSIDKEARYKELVTHAKEVMVMKMKESEGKICDEYKSMKKQEKDIKNPELVDVAKTSSITKIVEESRLKYPTKTGEIPDVPDFLM